MPRSRLAIGTRTRSGPREAGSCPMPPRNGSRRRCSRRRAHPLRASSGALPDLRRPDDAEAPPPHRASASPPALRRHLTTRIGDQSTVAADVSRTFAPFGAFSLMRKNPRESVTLVFPSETQDPLRKIRSLYARLPLPGRTWPQNVVVVPFRDTCDSGSSNERSEGRATFFVVTRPLC